MHAAGAKPRAARAARFNCTRILRPIRPCPPSILHGCRWRDGGPRRASPPRRTASSDRPGWRAAAGPASRTRRAPAPWRRPWRRTEQTNGRDRREAEPSDRLLFFFSILLALKSTRRDRLHTSGRSCTSRPRRPTGSSLRAARGCDFEGKEHSPTGARDIVVGLLRDERARIASQAQTAGEHSDEGADGPTRREIDRDSPAVEYLRTGRREAVADESFEAHGLVQDQRRARFDVAESLNAAADDRNAENSAEQREASARAGEGWRREKAGPRRSPLFSRRHRKGLYFVAEGVGDPSVGQENA